MKILKTLAVVFALLLLSPKSFAASYAESLRLLPVQDAGRLKPYDTFAREALELIHGKAKFKGKPAIEVVTTWMVIPDSWDEIELIAVRHSGLRDALKLENKRILYTATELLKNERFPLVLQELRSKRQEGEKLNPYFQAVQLLENQLSLYQAIKMGVAIRVVPQADKDAWLAASELQEPHKQKFAEILSEFVKSLNAGVEGKGDSSALDKAVHEFIEMARTAAPDKYASSAAISVEVNYNRIHPFMWAWICYLLAAIGFVAFKVSEKDRWKKMGWGFFSLGMVLHVIGMAIRSYLAGRPPVSNMYETVVWVPFGVLLFSIFIYRMGKKVLVPLAACLVAILCLILTDLAPSVLDDSIQPLEPRSEEHTS